jgi:hypothetical protein
VFPTVALAVVLLELAIPRVSCGALLFDAPFLSFDTGRTPTSVALGDVNGDGRLDLAVADSSSNTVSILMGADVGGRGRAEGGRSALGTGWGWWS